MSDRKEWIKVSRSAKGECIVTVSQWDDGLSVKYAVRAIGLRDPIKNGVVEARAGADAMLREVREALDA